MTEDDSDWEKFVGSMADMGVQVYLADADEYPACHLQNIRKSNGRNLLAEGKAVASQPGILVTVQKYMSWQILFFPYLFRVIK